MVQDRLLTCTSCGIRFAWSAEPDAEAPAVCPGCRFILPIAGRHRGVVKFYNKRKGWGFITQTDGKEIFFHRSALAPDHEPFLVDGELVEYALEESDRGPQAIAMHRLEVATPAEA